MTTLQDDGPAHSPKRLIASGELPTQDARIGNGLTKHEPQALSRPRFYGLFSSAIALVAVVAPLGLLSLFVVSQVVTMQAQMRSLPPAIYQCLTVLLLLFGGLFLMGMLWLLRAYWKLRIAEQVSLQHINDRYDWQENIPLVSPGQARETLERYVERYPLPQEKNNASHDPGTAMKLSSTLGIERVSRMAYQQRRLLDANRTKSSQQWLDLYRSRFQAELDQAAEDCRQTCAKQAGLKTALSPTPLVDTLISIYWSFQMLRKLCEIYQLRVGKLGSCYLLGQVFIHAYLAGRIDESEELAGDSLEAMFDDTFGEMLESPLTERIAGKFMSLASTKAAAGMANYFLVLRLGRRAMERLKPLR